MSCNKRLKTDGGTLQPPAATGAGGVDFSGGDRGPEPRPLVGAVGRGVDALSADVLPLVFGFLVWKDILRARVCRKWKEAASCTEATTIRVVNSPRAYNIMVGLTAVLPNLQQLELSSIVAWQRFEDGEDPTTGIYPARETFGDVGVIGAFRSLRHLSISGNALNGRYPCLFNFSRLQKLHIKENTFLKWEIGMLAGTPQLRELVYSEDWIERPEEPLAGDIASFSVVKETLEILRVECCTGLTGDYRGLADFPRLKEVATLNSDITGCLGGASSDWLEPGSFPNLEVLQLGNATKVTGDVRKLQVQHFPKLRTLSFVSWNKVFGFKEFERIEDAAGVAEHSSSQETLPFPIPYRSLR
ncbi:hypothetical protein ACHAXT_003371 [Thalassiosira profunda]